MEFTTAPCYGHPYCERGSCFIHQRGQDLLLAHLLHAVGVVAHRDRQLLHHLDPRAAGQPHTLPITSMTVDLLVEAS